MEKLCMGTINHKFWLGLIMFIFIFGVLTARSAVRESLTFDEPAHVFEGLAAWRMRTFEHDVVNPPLVRELAVIPLLIADRVGGRQTNLGNFDISRWSLDDVLPARAAVIFMGVLLVSGVYTFAYLTAGLVPAVFSALFFALNPNVLAHSHYVTLDIGYSLFVFVSFALTYRLLRKPDLPTVVFCGIAWGCALSAKASAPMIISGILIINSWFIYRQQFLRKLFSLRKLILTAVAVMFVVVWAAYGFRTDSVISPDVRSGRLWEKYYNRTEKSHPVVAKMILFLRDTPIPLGTYFRVLKNALIYTGQQSGSVFFMGHEYTGSRAYFLPLMLLLKNPLPFLIMALCGMLLSVTGHISRRHLLTPVTGLVILLVLAASGAEPYVRYALPVLPFLSIAAGLGAAWMWQRGFRLLVFGMGLWLVSSMMLSYPHYLTYVNESFGLIVPKYAYLTDSNLDWGQGLLSLKNYTDIHQPSVLYLSYFGRDNADSYGFKSDFYWGSTQSQDICRLHRIPLPGNRGRPLTAISVTNWRSCGYSQNPTYDRKLIRDTVADTFLIY